MARRFKSYPKHPSKIGTSSLAGADLTRNGDALDDFDMSEPKRVKFTLPEATQVTKWDAPKTSEYVFFKKLKKDIGDAKSHPLHKEDVRSNITKANTETSTYSSAFKHNNGILRSSSRAEKEGPSNEFAFLSPTGFESRNLVIQERIPNGISQNPSLIFGNVVGFDQKLLRSPSAVSAKNLGNQYTEKEVFSVKRQRLHKLATDIFPEARECKMKGFDLVSALISRLLPRSNETKERTIDAEYRLLPRSNETKEKTIDAEYHLPAFPCLDTMEKTSAQDPSRVRDGSCWDDGFSKYQSGRQITENPISKERIMDAEYLSPNFLKRDTLEKTQYVSKIQDGSCWDDVFPEYQSGRPRDRVLSKWDLTTSYLPCIKYNAETDYHDEEANYSCGVDDKDIHCLLPESDSSFCTLPQNRRYASPDHLIKLDEFHAPNEPAREEAQNLLLSWDVKEGKRKNPYSSSGDLSDSACQRITTCSSSLRSNHSLDFLSRSFFHCDKERYHEDDYLFREADLFPLSLSLTPKHLNMGEDSDLVSHLENDYVNLPQHGPLWCASKDASKNGDLGDLPRPRGLLHLGWKYLPKSDFLENYSSNHCIFQFPFKEELHSYAAEEDEKSSLYHSLGEKTLASSDCALDINNWSSARFKVSSAKMMGHPLLLEYPERVGSEEVTYFDNDGPWRSS